MTALNVSGDDVYVTSYEFILSSDPFYLKASAGKKLRDATVPRGSSYCIPAWPNGGSGLVSG